MVDGLDAAGSRGTEERQKKRCSKFKEIGK